MLELLRLLGEFVLDMVMINSINRGMKKGSKIKK